MEALSTLSVRNASKAAVYPPRVYRMLVRRERRMTHTIAKKSRLLNRVRRISGQIEAIERALETEEGCSVVLQRIAAARGAMNALMSEVLEDHVKSHVLTSKARANVAAADELLDVIKTYLK
jgi:FrmR/RcnR family transcriptional regulator, repressor of frmRAB operon